MSAPGLHRFLIHPEGAGFDMRFLIDRWRGIGTRLYLALGFAVILTLVSSGVGVYYFERSGDLNYEAESEGVPVLEASWDAAREAERLRSLGLELMAGGGTRSLADLRSAVDQSIARLEEALVQPNSVSELAADAMAVQDAA
jgi:phosphoglycerate-specific signal transduction histidine kinase